MARGTLPYNFVIYRSEDSNTWSTAGSTVDTYFYVDTTPNTLRLIHNYFYKVKVITSEGLEETSEFIGIYPAIYTYHKYIIAKLWREQDICWKKVNGSLINIYKKKQWGTYCTECVDSVTKDRTEDNCITCYSTGFIGGYWPVIEAHGHWKLQQQTEQSDHPGITEIRYEIVQMHAFPILQKEDLIVNPYTHERFTVFSSQIFKMHDFPTHQTVQVSKIGTDSILYQVGT
jgi:hypothetical protein